ncbi:MAG: hypothetical protein FWG07_03560 [Treponema sp.]|nr:hypothetical protein [Treponema sp.]
MKKALFLAGLLVFLAGGVWGQDTYIWSSTAINYNWNDSSNWDKGVSGSPADPGEYPGSAAVPGDTAIFPVGPGVTVTISVAINSLDALTIDSGVILTLDTGGIGNNLGDVTVTGGASLTLSDDLDCAVLINQGTLNLGANNLSAVTITNNGTLNLDGSGTQLVTPTTVSGTGTVVFGNNGTHLAGIDNFTNVTINDGNRNIGGAALDVSGNFNQTTGTLTVASLTMNNGSTIQSTNNIAGQVNISGTVGVSGTINITTASGILTIDNSSTLNLGANNLSATTITNNGTLNLDGSGTQSVTPATVSGTGTVVFGNNGTHLAGIDDFTNVTINNGNRDVPNTIDVENNLTIGSGAILDLGGSSIALGIAATFTSSGSLRINQGGSTITQGGTVYSTAIPGTVEYYHTSGDQGTGSPPSPNYTADLPQGYTYTTLFVQNSDWHLTEPLAASAITVVSPARLITNGHAITGTTTGDVLVMLNPIDTTRTYGAVTLAAAPPQNGSSWYTTGSGDFSFTSLTMAYGAVLSTVGTDGVVQNGTAANSIGGDITVPAGATSGIQFTGQVTLTNDVEFTGGTGNLIQFNDAVIGTAPGMTLTVTTANARFDGSVGGNIASVTVGGTSTINTDITTTGNQTYTGAVTLGTNVTLEGLTVTMGAITGGGYDLMIDGAGVLNGGSGLGILQVTGTSTINADITTSGNQIYNGSVTLGDDVVLTGGGVSGSLVDFVSTITGDVTGRALTVANTNVSFGGAVGGNITDVSVTDANSMATINADISTTGDQSYNGAVTLTGTPPRVLTSSGGSVTATGAVSGTQLVVNASTGINLGNTGNTVITSTTLTNTSSGDIIFTNTSSNLLLTATNYADPGTTTIDQTGDLTINSLQTPSPGGSIILRSTGTVIQNNAITTGILTLGGTGNIFTLTHNANNAANIRTTAVSGNYPNEINFTNANNLAAGPINAGTVTLYTNDTTNNDITITGPMTISAALAITAGPDPAPGVLPGGSGDYCGDVTISAAINSSAATITIKAASVTNTGGIAGSAVSILLDYLEAGSGQLGTILPVPSIGPRHSNVDLIYYTGTLPGGAHLPVSAVQVLSTSYTGNFNFTGFRNVYLVNVSDGETRTVTVNTTAAAPNGFIEFYDSYAYTGTSLNHLNLATSGGGGIRSYSPTDITGVTTIDMGTASGFSIDAINILQGSLSIKANGITLTSVSGTAGQDNNLALYSIAAAAAQNISVSGTLGTNSQPLGDIAVTNAAAATFTGAVWADSFTQSASTAAGTTTFSASQIYSGNFAFTGNILNVNNSLDAGGTITITNSGRFTKSISATQHIVATGAFLQNGAGVNTGNTIGANITASAITFSNLVELSANAVFTTTGNGNIVLPGDSAGTIATADTSGADRNLTLTAAGTGSITLGLSSAPPTDNTVDLGTGLLTVTAATVTTAGTVPLNIGTGTPPAASAATRLTITAGTDFTPQRVLTVWGTVINNGTITAQDKMIFWDAVTNNGIINAKAPIVASDNDSIVFNGNYNGSTGTIVDTGSSKRIILNGLTAAVGSFNNTTDTLVLKGQYVPSGTSQGFSHNSGIPLYIVRIENRNNTSTGINTVQLESDIVQTDNGTGGQLYFDMTPNTSGPRLYTTANWIWRMGTGVPPTTPVPPFSKGFVNYKGEVFFDLGSELHTQDFLAPQAGSVSPYTYTFNGPASIWASGNVDIRDDAPGNVFITAPNELNIFTLVMDGGGPVQFLHCEQVGSSSHAAIGSLRLTGNGTRARIINSIEVQGDVFIEPGTTLYAGNPGDSITIHVTGYSAGAKWYQTDYLELGKIDGPSGTFVPYNSTVEFGSRTDFPAGRTFEIAGDTDWYNFSCFEPKADLLFSNYGVSSDLHSHTIHNRFTVEPRHTDNTLYGSATDITNMIKLSRLDDTQLIPNTNNIIGQYGPPTAPNNDFWYFYLGSGAELFFNFVYLNYSYSQRRIPLPYGDPAQYLVVATPYYNRDPDNPNVRDPRLNNDLEDAGHWSYYNVNWFVANNFFYSFTEDSNGNGKIDRIRAQAAFELMDRTETSPETGYRAFQYFDVIVDGYEIDTSRGDRGYDRVPNASDCIYIYVREKPYLDGGATLRWRIERNQSLMDATTKSIFIGDPGHGYHQTSDTVPPRINYALVLPGHTELFFQLSEPVDTDLSDGIMVNLGSGSFAPQTNLGRGEFLVQVTPYNLDQLAAGTEYFDLDNVRDTAGFVRDRRSQPGVFYSYQYPSPKYPKDWDYSEYIEVRGWYFPDDPIYIPFTTVAPNPADPPPPLPLIRDWGTSSTPPSRLGNLMFGKTNGLSDVAADYGSGKHRLTDLLISIPPNDISAGSSQHNYFFVWPLWAKYASEDSGLDDLLGNTLHPGYGYMGHDGSNLIETSIIWDFTGKRFLERDDIVMQSRISNVFTSAASPLAVFYVTGLSDDYKAATVNGSAGLWHPYQYDPPLSDMVLPPNPPPAPQYPRPDPPPVITENQFLNMVPWRITANNAPLLLSPSSLLYNHSFGKSDFPGNATVEFLYRTSVSDLLAARLDVPPGTDPSALTGQPWYRWVRPFTFGVHDITRQRGGVTILNNVINSNNRERVYVDYKPESSGRVTIQVFTLDGNLVRILKRESEIADGKYHRVSWDGTNQGGRPVARGMYFIRVVAPGIDEIRKVMVVK